MKKIALLAVLIVCGCIAFYLYIDTNAPVISWDVEPGESINRALKIAVHDDVALQEVCYSISGGSCSGAQSCSREIQGKTFELLIEPDQCVVNSEPLQLEISVSTADTSLLPNKADSSMTLTYDDQAPNLTTLQGSLSLKQGGTGVVLYEVGEVPSETGVVLGDLFFRAFEFEQNRYLSFYVHPYDVDADDFKPRVFAVDAAGNLRKIRPGSRTASRAYHSEVIKLTDGFLEDVKDKMMATSPLAPLQAFVEVNNRIREENYRKISQICRTTEPKKLWQGAFLRNQGATRAGFADSRTYQYGSEVISQQVHLGLDIAGINNTQVFAANHGKVVFVGELGIYGNVIVVDHGYGLHSLYGHLNRADVQEGDSVRKGEIIGLSGETGLAFGDHLHYEMRVNGVAVNPIEWFDEVWVKNNIEGYLTSVATTE